MFVLLILFFCARGETDSEGVRTALEQYEYELLVYDHSIPYTEGTGQRGQSIVDERHEQLLLAWEKLDKEQRSKFRPPPKSPHKVSDDGSFGVMSGIAALARKRQRDYEI